MRAIDHASSLLALFLVLTVAAASAWAEEDSARYAFVGAYRCAVVDIIARIHARSDVEQNRFFILSVEDKPSANYVQCIFEDDHDSRMYCEAASGFYERAPGAPPSTFVPPRAREALGTLGFSTDDSKGNFALETDVAGIADYGRVADLMLEALYSAYGARARSVIEVHAPLLDQPEILRPLACPAIS
jgi:hypothetical protein